MIIGVEANKSFSHLKPYDIRKHERLERACSKGFGRVPILQREKAAYAILRRVGLSINQISKAFGRSTSLVHRTLKVRRKRGHFIPKVDMRKLPYYARMILSARRWHKMLTLLSQWISWVCGEGDKPP